MKKITFALLFPLLLVACSSPINIDDYNFDYFKEFKEMVDSLTYFEFDESKSINPSFYDEYRFKITYNNTLRLSFNSDEYNLDYLKFLSDSVLYPTCFSGNVPNISGLNIYITNEQFANNLNPTLERGYIEEYAVSVTTYDYYHTDPKNPLISLSLSVKSLHFGDTGCGYVSSSIAQSVTGTYTNEMIELDYIYFIMPDSNLLFLRGHFHKDDYCYQMSSVRQ